MPSFADGALGVGSDILKNVAVSRFADVQNKLLTVKLKDCQGQNLEFNNRIGSEKASISSECLTWCR